MGEHRYSRAVLATSVAAAGGDLLFGVDTTYDDGPWLLQEKLRKANVVIKYTHGDAVSGFSVEGMGYDAKWRSTDQIPLRAVQSGQITRFGFIDPTDGGNTHRYSLSGKWWGDVGPGHLQALLYGIDYQLNLFSNFTYFTHPAVGDQFEQYDKRHVYGTDVRYTQPVELFDSAGDFRCADQKRPYFSGRSISDASP